MARTSGMRRIWSSFRTTRNCASGDGTTALSYISPVVLRNWILPSLASVVGRQNFTGVAPGEPPVPDTDGWFRRTSPVAGRAREGLLTEPIAVARPGARELVLMPRCSHCSADSRYVETGHSTG